MGANSIWMTASEAANVLDTDASVIRNWLKRGLLKGRKRSSREWLVDAASVYHLRAQRQARLAAVYAALDSLPVAPHGKPQPSGIRRSAAASPMATNAAGVAETPHSAPGGSPTQSPGASAGGIIPTAGLSTQPPIIPAACRGMEVQ